MRVVARYFDDTKPTLADSTESVIPRDQRQRRPRRGKNSVTAGFPFVIALVLGVVASACGSSNATSGGASTTTVTASSPSASSQSSAQGGGFDSCVVGSWLYQGSSSGVFQGLGGMTVTFHSDGAGLVDLSKSQPETGVSPTTYRGTDILKVTAQRSGDGTGQMNVTSEKSAVTFSNSNGTAHDAQFWDAASYTCNGKTLSMSFVGLVSATMDSLADPAVFSRQ